MKPSRKKPAKTYKPFARRSSRTSKSHYRSLVPVQQPGPSSQLHEEGNATQLEEDDTVSAGDDANATASPVLSSFRDFAKGPCNQDDAEKLVTTLTSSKLLYPPGDTLSSDSEDGYEAASLETSRGIMRGKSSKAKGNGKGKRKAVSCCLEISHLLLIEGYLPEGQNVYN